jgi:hypothetical protein
MRVLLEITLVGVIMENLDKSCLRITQVVCINIFNNYQKNITACCFIGLITLEDIAVINGVDDFTQRFV